MMKKRLLDKKNERKSCKKLALLFYWMNIYEFSMFDVVRFTGGLGFLQNLVLSHLAKNLGRKTKKDKILDPATLDCRKTKNK